MDEEEVFFGENEQTPHLGGLTEKEQVVVWNAMIKDQEEKRRETESRRPGR